MIDTKKKETPWENELDAKKYLAQVHMDFTKYLGTDFKLAKFTDQEREFIITMVGAGLMAVDICPHPDIGMQIKELDFTYINALAVLKFNVEGNMIVDRITNWQQQQEAEEEESAWIEKIQKKLDGKARLKEAPE